MADEKKEPWLNYLALCTVILAVCATISTFKGGGYSTRSVLAQSQASDQWAYYQAKSIKGNLSEMQKERLELEFKGKGKGMPGDLAEIYERKIEAYSKKIKKYDDEKALIEKEARGLEAVRDEAQKHSGVFGKAVIFLQIAILLSSIAALLKKKPLWLAGMAIGAIGIFYFIDGFYLFML